MNLEQEHQYYKEVWEKRLLKHYVEFVNVNGKFLKKVIRVQELIWWNFDRAQAIVELEGGTIITKDFRTSAL